MTFPVVFLIYDVIFLNFRKIWKVVIFHICQNIGQAVFQWYLPTICGYILIPRIY